MQPLTRRGFLRAAAVTGLSAATGCVAAACAPGFIPTQRFRLAIIGDVRTSGMTPPPVFEQIADRVAALTPDAVLTMGDMVEANAQADILRRQWQYFKEVAAHVKAPAWYTPGNHDTLVTDQAIELFKEAFPEMPQNGPDPYKGAVYSVDAGPVHVVSVLSEDRHEQHRINDVQLAWLEDDLAKYEHSLFKFVMTHEPMVVAGRSTGNSLDAFGDQRDKLQQVLAHNNAIFLAGHVHYYWRTQVQTVPQWVFGTSGSDIDTGRPGTGEFKHYAIFDLKGRTLDASVYDESGQLRDSWSTVA